MSRIESTVVADEVYRQIKIMIIEGTLEPGSRIDRQILAEGLGVSMTPVNEAVARLVGERFIERRLGSTRGSDGFFVPESQREALVHLFEIRAGIEGIAARLCVERIIEGSDDNILERIKTCFSQFSSEPHTITKQEIDDYIIEDIRFHGLVIEGSGNPILGDIDRNLGCIHVSKVKGLIRPPNETLPEHKALIKAMIAKDSVLAQNLMAQHQLRSRDVLLETLKKSIR
jgi:DNA-binding GntR family transcriptional regulator